MRQDYSDVIELEPQFKPRVWGGRRLAERFGVNTTEPIGEVWMVYDENIISSGPYAGRKLADVLPELGEAFLGKAVVERYGYCLPLMVKLLDTAQWLSVQVHPDDAYARIHEAESGWFGKAEAWVVLEAEPDAQVIYGVKRPVTREELRAAALDGSILELLNFVPVKKGDVIYVPPGTIHALGPGLLVYEVSQRSDLTYRLYDYGRGRELHLDRALDVVWLEPQAAEVDVFSPRLLLDEKMFALSVVSGVFRAPKDTCVIGQEVKPLGSGWVLAAGKVHNVTMGLHLYAYPKAADRNLMS